MVGYVGRLQELDARLSGFKLETSHLTLYCQIGFVCTTTYRLLTTAYGLLPFGFLDVSVMRSFNHNKTLLDARLLTQKAKIPQKCLPPDAFSPEGERQGQGGQQAQGGRPQAVADP